MGKGYQNWTTTNKRGMLVIRWQCNNLMPPSPMKKCLPLGKLKNSAKVSASVQSQPDSSG